MKEIEYGFSDSPFGDIVIARTDKGICDLQFLDYSRMQTIHELGLRWGKYTPTTQNDDMARQVSHLVFRSAAHQLPVDLHGTDFQQCIWNELMNIPFGRTVSYGEVARRIGQPESVRAVATAIGQNPVAVIVPCHRVIRSDGSYGDYHWGSDLKRRLIEWERNEVNKTT